MQKYFFHFIFLDNLRAGSKSRLGLSFMARLIYSTCLAGGIGRPGGAAERGLRLGRRERADGRGLTGVG